MRSLVRSRASGGGGRPPHDHATRWRYLGLAAVAVVALISICLMTPAPTEGFGTINGLGQRAEHERITRAALACPPGVLSTGDCFEPRSIDQLAGHTGTFGAVGAPDSDEFTVPTAHCDDADFLNVPGYPQTRAAATAALMNCVTHLRGRFAQGVSGAAGLLDGDGELIGSEVDLTTDCTFFGGVPGRAKCNAIEGLGRALHGAQDFYSHSNWADESDPTRGIDVNNPPGLNLPGPSSILDLAGTSTPVVPVDLTTGYYAGVIADAATFCTGLLSGLNTRVTHACLNKDLELINPVSGAVSDPQTPRGQVLSNASKAVAGAIVETQRQWQDFKNALIATYGADQGNRMILAITQDVPKVDLVFAIDTTGSMGPYIAQAVAAANDVVDALSGRGTPPRLTDYRVGLVDYKDVDSDPALGCPPDAYDATTDLAFSTTRSAIVSAIGTLPGKVGGGCDIPEDVLSGIQRAVNFPWRDGVAKAIILMGDAPGHDPEAHSGLTSASVIAAALAVDPAVIYPILVGGSSSATAFMTNLANGTGGQTFNGNSGGVGQAVLDAIHLIVTTPPPPPSDTTAPECTAAASPGALWPPNQKLVPVTVEVTVTDDQPGATFTLMDATSSEPASGAPDIQGFTLGEPSTAGSFRAERLGNGPGRIYTLTYEAVDAAGNTGTCTALVSVPHDQRQ